MARWFSSYDDAKAQGLLWTPELIDPSVRAFWIDMSRRDSLTLVSGRVAAADDLWGIAPQFASTTASQRLAYGDRTRNGLPYAYYDVSGANQGNLTASNVSIADGSGNHTSVGMYQIHLTISVITGLFGVDGANDYEYRAGNSNKWLSQFRTINLPTVNTQTSYNFLDGRPHTFATRLDTTAAIISKYDDGGYNPGYTVDPQTYNGTLSSPALVRLGGRSAGTQAPDLDFYEHIMLKCADCALELKIMAYIHWKWGLQEYLRSDNPWFNRPPLISD